MDKAQAIMMELRKTVADYADAWADIRYGKTRDNGATLNEARKNLDASYARISRLLGVLEEKIGIED